MEREHSGKTNTLIPKFSEAQIGSPVSYVYSFKEIKDLLVGFHIQKIYKDHIFPYKIKKYKQYEYEKVWYFWMMPASLFRLLKKVLGWHTMVIARLL